MALLSDHKLAELSHRLRVTPEQVQATASLLEAGFAIPFLARFRGQATGGLSESQICDLRDAKNVEEALEARKSQVLKAAAQQDRLTAELQSQLAAARSQRAVEELYLPLKQKRDSAAAVARQRGLEPLANDVLAGGISVEALPERLAAFVSPENELASTDDVVDGVCELIVERMSHRSDVRRIVRQALNDHGVITATEYVDPDAIAHSDNAKAAPEAGEESAAMEERNPTAGHVAAAGSATETEPPDVDAANEAKSEAQSPSAELPPTDSPAPPTEAKNAESTTAEKKSESTDASQSPQTVAESVANRRRQRREARRKKRDSLRASFKSCFGFSDPIGKVTPHRMLMLDRGERVRVLDVKLVVDEQPLQAKCLAELVPESHPQQDLLQKCAERAIQQRLLPTLEREARREKTERAEEHVVQILARNLRKIYMAPPLRVRVLAVDPGLKFGCKVAALDERGVLLADSSVHAIGDVARVAEGRRRLKALIDEHKIDVIAIGDGTGCRQAETTVSTLLNSDLADRKIPYVTVSEAGSTVYSNSPDAARELPAVDPRLRATISIGRRLLDPLTEFAKVDPLLVAPGPAQIDFKSNRLQHWLTDVVCSCVNQVGVDANNAPAALLALASGMTTQIARNLCEHRQENAPFRTREDLKGVPGIDEGVFEQVAAFLIIPDGDNPLDATRIHPADYGVVEKILAAADTNLAELKAEIQRLAAVQSPQIKPPASTPANQSTAVAVDEIPQSPAAESSAPSPWEEKISRLQPQQLAEQLGEDPWRIKDVLAILKQPGRDPRCESLPPVFRYGVSKLEDLQPQTELSATVLSVVEYGAFVDIGLRESGLVHISQLADKFVRDPNDIVSPGDILRVWVVSVDSQKRRVSLTAIPPGTQRAPKKDATRKPRARRSPPAGKGRKPKRPRDDRTSDARRRRPKPPTKPITEGMRNGSEPMRTFGDLAQFYDSSRTGSDDSAEKPKDAKGSGK